VATYRIVPSSSRAWVEATTSVHPVHGEADGLEGFIDAELRDGRLDLDALPSMRLELEIERLTSGNPLYDNEMRRRVQTRRYPTVVGEAREFEEAGPGRYRVGGDLSFHGVTRRVAGEVRIGQPDERTVQVEGEQVFDVREFGVEPPRILMLRVHPDVRVRVRVVAELEQ
jgi:polyisoprenoid-binding protein YceI